MTAERRGFTLGVWCLAVLTAPVLGQQAAPDRDGSVERVRTLYVAAAYEDALAAMPEAGGTAVRTDLEQYRALCLLALGRDTEAVAVVERLVTDNPLFIPSAAETPPRMLAIFMAARSKLVPGIAKHEFDAAKTAFEANGRDAARAGFQRTMDLIGSLPDVDRAVLANMRLVASEFLVPPAAPRRAAQASPPANPADETVGGEPRTEAEYVAPVAVYEQLPAWFPPDDEAMRTTYVGVLRVVIREDGRVARATILENSHPTYDAAALRAARLWLYKPATKRGTPVAAEKDIRLRLVPK